MIKKLINKFLDWFYRKEQVEKEKYLYTPLIKIYVVALNYKHFQNWCNKNAIHVNDKSLRYVTDISVLRGVDGRYAKFVFYGPWRERKDATELKAQIKVIETIANL